MLFQNPNCVGHAAIRSKSKLRGTRATVYRLLDLLTVSIGKLVIFYRQSSKKFELFFKKLNFIPHHPIKYPLWFKLISHSY
jgi:hypothetical protein